MKTAVSNIVLTVALRAALMPGLSTCQAQRYAIDWYKVSGGGTINSGGRTNSLTMSPPTGNLCFRLKQ